MQAITIESARADLRLAKSIFYEKLLSNTDYYMLNLAAYHAGQAMEKLIKDLIREHCSNDVYRDLYDKHNFESLLKALNEKLPDFNENHKFIAVNADELSKFNNLRYGKQYIEKDTVYLLLKEAKNFFREMETAYLSEFSDTKQNHIFAARVLKERGCIKLTDTGADKKERDD